MRIRAGVVSLGLGLVVALGACGPGQPQSDQTSGSPQGTGSLTIWSGWGDYQILQDLCGAWARDRFASCDVYPKGLADLKRDFEAAATTGGGPDILAYANDALGEFVADGQVSPIDLRATANQFVDVAIDALQVDGTLYAVPTAVENVALLTNRALSPQCPASMEQLTEQARRLVEDGTSVEGVALGMQVEQTGDAYHWHPLYTAGGGYLFGRDQQGDLNLGDLGVGTPGSVRAGVKLQELAQAGVVRADQSRQVLERAFTLGKLAWWITGPWSLPAATEAGVDLAVCPVPTWADGSPSQPLVGVQALFLSSRAPSKDLATDFLTTYAPSDEFQEGMMASGRPPARKTSLAKAMASDPTLAGFAAYAQQGVPMPSIPEMDTVWAELGAAEVDILTGGDPQAAMTTADEKISAALDAGK